MLPDNRTVGTGWAGDLAITCCSAWGLRGTGMTSAICEYNSLLYLAIEKGMINRSEGDTVIRVGMLSVFKSDDLIYVDKTQVAAALKPSMRTGFPYWIS